MFEESTVDIPSICLSDDTSVLSVEPRYDEYNDDYNIVSIEKIVAGFSWKDDGLQIGLSHDFGHAIVDDIEGCSDILFGNDPENYKSKHTIVLDVSKPQDHIFF